MKKNVSKLLGFAGIIVFVLSEILLFKKIEPVYTWFYDFAWWSYIFVIDAVVFYREGKSLVFGRFKEFCAMIPWSVVFWLFFEMVNLNLKNWHYINLPDIEWVRWIGFFFAYATVLPAIVETSDLLYSFKFLKNHGVQRVAVTKTWYSISVIIGLCFLFLPLLIPKYFFPFIWGSFIFICEPFLHRWNENSLLKQWERGSLRNFIILLYAGFICGGLWEFWNFWAKAKWIYTVPWAGNLKIFEMPVLGFLGFPPFAVQVLVMWYMVRALTKRKYLPSTLLMIPVFLVYYFICFKAIDLFTFIPYQ
ncbi:MAG: hypothetical protein ABII23_02155 [bacterium]